MKHTTEQTRTMQTRIALKCVGNNQKPQRCFLFTKPSRLALLLSAFLIVACFSCFDYSEGYTINLIDNVGQSNEKISVKGIAIYSKSVNRMTAQNDTESYAVHDKRNDGMSKNMGFRIAPVQKCCFQEYTTVLNMQFRKNIRNDSDESNTGNGSAEVAEELERLSEETDFSDWQSYFDELQALAKSSNEYSSVEDMIEDIALSGADVKFDNLLSAMRDMFIPSVVNAVKRMLGIMAISILTGICGIALGNREGSAKSMLLLFLCAAAILSITAVFSELAAESLNTINRVEQFSAAASPVMLGLLTALGCTSTARIMQPTLLFLVNGIIAFMKTVIMPMLFASGVLTIIDGIADRFKVGRMVKLLRKSVKWMIGLAATIYIAVTAVGGMTAATADGVSIRTARYAIDRLIPAAGGMVTGAVDAVIGSSLLLKNSAGMVAIIIVVAAVIRPLLDLVAGMLAMRLASAICEPFSDERIPKMLDGVAETVSYMFAASSAVVSMFIVVLVIIVSTGNMLL